MPKPIRLFLSTVSDEFRAYRDQLGGDRTRHNVEVKVQEDFKDLGGATLEKLEPMYRRALAIDEASFGLDRTNNNLAGLLRATNRPAGAEPMYRRAALFGSSMIAAMQPLFFKPYPRPERTPSNRRT